VCVCVCGVCGVWCVCVCVVCVVCGVCVCVCVCVCVFVVIKFVNLVLNPSVIYFPTLSHCVTWFNFSRRHLSLLRILRRYANEYARERYGIGRLHSPVLGFSRLAI